MTQVPPKTSRNAPSLAAVIALLFFVVRAALLPAHSAQETTALQQTSASTLSPASTRDTLTRFDLKIVNGFVVDGSGKPGYHADVGIRGGHIAAIGDLADAPARATVDAHGLVVAPGFIDAHTNIESQVRIAKRLFTADNFVKQGVTTVITGNCGRSAPDIAALFRKLESLHLPLNVATLVGHNTIRQEVCGMRPNPTPAELDRMKAMVGAALDAGAVGFSTGLCYKPGVFAGADEVTALVSVAARLGAVYATHVRDEGSGGMAALQEAIQTAGRAGETRLHICHFKAAGRSQYGTADARLALLRHARSQGLQLTFDLYPYTAAATNLQYLIPPLAYSELSARRLQGASRFERAVDATLAKLHGDGWDDYGFVRVAYSVNKSWVGRTIPEIVASLSSKRDPSARDEAAWILREQARGELEIIAQEMDERDLRVIIREPESVFGSDSSVHYPGWGRPHPRGSGTFPRVFAEYVRGLKLFSLEEAVCRSTGRTAETFELPHRGLIRQGYWADLVVFDPDRIQDRATAEDPWAPPVGIAYVIENGVIAAHDGKVTSAFAGRPVRRGRD